VRWGAITVAALAVWITVGSSVGRGQKAGDGTRAVMAAKLRLAQNILEGLTHEDFPYIVRQASQLLTLTRQAGWRALEQPEYLRRSTDFRQAITRVADAAGRRNLDAATLGYVQMTMACINCHKYVRNPEVDRPLGR